MTELGYCALQVFHDEEWRLSLQTLLQEQMINRVSREVNV